MIAFDATSSRLRWAAVIAWMTLIFFLSSRSTLPRPPDTPPSVVAITGHLVAYAVLALLVARALLGHGRTLPWSLAVAWLVALAYGVSDEIHQSFVPGRDPALFDVATDALGAALALTALWWRRQLGRRRAEIRPTPP